MESLNLLQEMHYRQYHRAVLRHYCEPIPRFNLLPRPTLSVLHERRVGDVVEALDDVWWLGVYDIPLKGKISLVSSHVRTNPVNSAKKTMYSSKER